MCTFICLHIHLFELFLKDSWIFVRIIYMIRVVEIISRDEPPCWISSNKSSDQETYTYRTANGLSSLYVYIYPIICIYTYTYMHVYNKYAYRHI